MTDLECRALIAEPPWYIHSHRCKRKATMFEGLALCGTHIRVLKQWAATRTPEELVSMVEFHWRLKFVRQA